VNTITDIFSDMTKVKVLDYCTPEDIPSSVLSSTEPIILKNLVSNWPVVQAAKSSPEQVCSYLEQYYQGMTTGAGVSSPENKGRLFYSNDFTQLNFTKEPAQLDVFLQQVLAAFNDENPVSRYIGSTPVDKLLPNFRATNDLAALAQHKPLVSIWLGNQSRIAAHHDTPNNIACCIAGKRRFTLFPPNQIENLYLGPLDFNPAGQAISLVDFHQVDFIKHPKFATALANAQVAELGPGDSLFLPSMWWHHVEGLSKLNILVNYWWQTNSAHMGAPMDALLHALLNIKELPKAQKDAWFDVFKFYIFNPDETALSHIPKQRLGVLKPTDDHIARQIRSMLLNKLNR